MISPGSSLTVATLKELCRSRGLFVSGNKVELIERLMQYGRKKTRKEHPFLETFGDYYLPRKFSPNQLKMFLSEKLCLKKIWLEDDPRFEKICTGFGFEFIIGRKITVLDLSKSEDQLWSELNRKRRNTIRSAIKNGVVIELAESTDALEAEQVWLKGSCTKHNLSNEYVSTMSEKINIWIERKILFVAKLDNKIIAGTKVAQSNCLPTNEVLYYSSNSSLQEYLKFNPNDLLIWEIVKYAKVNGFSFFNMGGGNLFKRKFSVMEPMVVNEWTKK
ncbi:GNAT family N-acetyltransferase [Deltaproteobacteria bacterium]|nr:GNAT family N-acetyltransferase [Deltaproteobacteria bacterium]